MGILILLAVAAALLFVCLKSFDLDKSMGFPVFMTAGVAFLVCVIFVITVICCYAQAPADMAQIAQLRQTAASTSEVEGPWVLLKVVEYNETIVGNRYYRSQWWARPFVPSQWDTASTIRFGR